MRNIELVFRLADSQHGVVARRQLRQAGLSRAAECSLVANGVLERLSSRTVRIRSAPHTDLQPVMAAVLDAGPGAAAADLTAAALWQVPGIGMSGEITLVRERASGTTRTALARLGTWRWLAPTHTTLVWSVPTLTLPVTLFRLGALLPWERFERVADTVCGRAPRVLDALHTLLPELAASGRNGVTAMRQFLDGRPVGYQGPHTNLESRVSQILRNAGERPLAHQVDLGGHSWLGRVDFLDRQVPFVLEVDSDTFHGMPTQVAHDAHRAARLEAAGFGRVVRIPESMVWHRPWRLVEIVQALRRGRPVPL